MPPAVPIPDSAVWLTRGTVWLALGFYTAAEASRAACRGRGNEDCGFARGLLSAGCAAFLAHVACAFSFYHSWSHADAYADTAQQTGQLTGWHWGGGIYINYAFAVVWLGEVFWLWVAPSGYLQRPPWITFAVRGFFLFMIFNGAVVFVPGPARWLGVLLCLILAACWWPRRTLD